MRIEQQHKVLEQSQEHITLYKAQGAIEVLKHIKGLRQNVMGNK